MRAEIGIVLPFRDAEATLERAVVSLREQTFGDWELWLWDDGSRDGSRALAERLTAGDRRCRVMASGGEGLVATLNRALDLLETPWVGRMDADDAAVATRWEHQLAAAAAHPDWDVIGGRVRIPQPQGEGMVRYVEWVNALSEPEEHARERWVESPLVHPSVMMRREAIGRLGGYRSCGWAEDHDLWLRVLGTGGKIGKTTEIVLDWEDRPERLTRTAKEYGEEARWAMRAASLEELGLVRERGVAVAGAGPQGKRLARALRAEGVRVEGFFDVHPRRVGEKIGGAPVAAVGELGRRWREAVLLGAVGVAGGREEVRRAAKEAGYREGEDFWLMC